MIRLTAFILLITLSATSLAFASEPVNADLRQSLIEIAENINASEARLAKITKLKKEIGLRQKQLEQKLKNNKETQARTFEAASRLYRRPLEFILFQPTSPRQIIQTSILIEASIPSIVNQQRDLVEAVEEYSNSIASLSKAEKEARRLNEELKNRHAKLDHLLKSRFNEAFPDSAEAGSYRKDFQRLAHHARSLREFVEKIDVSSEDVELRNTAEKLLESSVDLKELSRKDDPRLPVSGIIRTNYGETDPESLSTSRGLTIETRSGSIAIAPLSGYVKFAGTLRRLGSVIILEHLDGYHSIVTGLGRIDVVNGQLISAGEPIGLIQGVSSSNPLVYYELRFNGQPVDPAVKIATSS